MGNTLEHFDPVSEGFALVLESLEAAGVCLEADAHDQGEDASTSI